MLNFLNDVCEAVQNPALFRGEIRKFGQNINKWYHNSFYSCKGIDPFREDRDNLIILDGCRYDVFKQVNYISGSLESRISKGSSSREFFNKNFKGRKLHDTVYVTANPHIHMLESDTFHFIYDMLGYWNEQAQTVLPSELTDISKKVVEDNPNKRYIFHYMQPHYPFLGEKGQELNHRGYKYDLEQSNVSEPNIWEILQWGKDSSITEKKCIWHTKRICGMFSKMLKIY
jgi:hypothetical protein